MKRNNKMTISFSDDEIKSLEIKAADNNMKEAEYIRTMCCYGNDDYISKAYILEQIEKINVILDTYVPNERKLTKRIKKELNNIWQKLS